MCDVMNYEHLYDIEQLESWNQSHNAKSYILAQLIFSIHYYITLYNQLKHNKVTSILDDKAIISKNVHCFNFRKHLEI